MNIKFSPKYLFELNISFEFHRTMIYGMILKKLNMSMNYFFNMIKGVRIGHVGFLCSSISSFPNRGPPASHQAIANNALLIKAHQVLSYLHQNRPALTMRAVPWLYVRV